MLSDRVKERMTKSLEEKPGQPRCADCGTVYLWRSEVKLWELLSWQMAGPRDAFVLSVKACDWAWEESGAGAHTYGSSWYYFNGQPLSCSLCTVVKCDSCRRVFNWGDQFHRFSCLCGGKVVVTRRGTPSPCILQGPQRYECCEVPHFRIMGLSHWDRLCIRPVRCSGSGPVTYVRQFERRCGCCGPCKIQGLGVPLRVTTTLPPQRQEKR
jgi:hypothetical protein